MKEELNVFCGTVKAEKNVGQIYNDIINRALPSSYIPYIFDINIEYGGEEFTVVCGSQKNHAVGDTVYLVYCRNLKIDSMGELPIGVLIDEDIYQVLEKQRNSLLRLMEYGAFQYNGNRHITNKNSRQGNDTIAFLEDQDKSVSTKLVGLLKSRSNNSVLAFAQAGSSNANGNRYRTQLLIKDLPVENNSISFGFSYQMDMYTEVDANIAVILYLCDSFRGHLGVFCFPATMTKSLTNLDEKSFLAIKKLLLGKEFVLIGLALFYTQARSSEEFLHKSSYVLITHDPVVTNYGLTMSVKFLSHNSALKNPETDKYRKTILSNWKINRGNIVEVLANTINKTTVYLSLAPESEENKIILEERRGRIIGEGESKKKTPKKDNKAEKNTDAELAIFVVRGDEFRLFGENQKGSGFSPARFHSEILSGNLGPLHFEVLEWIGRFKFSVAQLIFRLFLCDVIPQDTTHFNDKEKDTAQQIKTALIEKCSEIKEIPDTGGESLIINYQVRENGVNRLSKVIDKLWKCDLIRIANFGSEKSECKSNILILTYKGQQLLDALGRDYIKADPFACLKTPYEVKESLSANQLCIAYLQHLWNAYQINLNELGLQKMFGHPMYPDIEQKVRLAFSMNVRRKEFPEKFVRLAGVSVRTPIGLTKDFEQKSYEEKTWRMLETMNQTASIENFPTVLTIVYDTYESMTSKYKDLISYFANGETQPADNLKICVTFDRLLQGNLDKTHFLVDLGNAKGELKHIENFNEFLDGLFNS